MPQAFALYALLSTVSTALAVVGTAIYVGLYVGMVVVVSKLGGMIAGKLGGGSGMGSGSLSSGSPLQMARDPVAARRIIYGETRVSGPMLDAFITGTNNEYLNMVVALAGHECQSIGDVYFNDEIEPLDGSGNATGTFAGFARVKKFLGATGQTADADFVADSGGQRSSTDKFDRIAGLYFRGKWDQAKWPGSFPNLSAVTKGRKCYDPRTGLTVWTDNPALCVRDYLINTEFGLAVDATELDDASFIAAANICDELVTLAAGGTEKRYRCNGSFETSAEPATVLEKLVESMAGAVVYIGGKWICYAGAHATPETSHLTEDDLRAQINVQTQLSMRDTCNRVRGTFASPAEKWQSTDFTPITNAFYLSEDGGLEIWRDLNLAFVTSHSQAQRLAKVELERTRQGITVSAPCKLTALRYKPGDVVPMDNAEMGWAGKLFVITSLKFSSYDAQGEIALGVDLELRETAAEVWDWNSGMETTYDPAPNTNLNNQRTVATPAAPTLSSSNFVQKDGTIVPRMQVQWVLPADTFVTSGGKIHLEYKKSADANWLVWSSSLRGNLTEDYITDVHADVSYDVRVRFENSARVVGAYSAVATLTIGHDTTVPATPTGLFAAGGPGCNIIDWDDNTETDFDHYELYRSTTNTFGSAGLVWSGYASQHADFGVAIGTTYYYWLKASDASDNLSAAAGSVNAAATASAGPAGGYTDFIFQRAASAPATPTGDTPAGWYGAPPAVDGNPLWMSTGDKTAAGVLVGTWSTPVNTDTALILEYSIDGSTSWHSTFTAGDFFARHRTYGGSFTAAYRIVGENGLDGADGTDGTDGTNGTVAGSFNGTGNTATSSSTPVVTVTGSVVISDSATHLIVASGRLMNGSGDGPRLPNVKLWRGSTQIGINWSFSIPYQGEMIVSINAADAPGPGTFTYEIRHDTDTTGKAVPSNIWVMTVN